MPNRTSLCGAPNSRGGTCRRTVPKAGDRCATHARRPKSAKEILKLSLQAAAAVSTITDMWDLFVRLYPHIEPFVDPVRGLLMPEYFWEAFYAKDRERMKLELEMAREKMDVLEERYRFFNLNQKLEIEDAYLAILDVTTRGSERSKGPNDPRC